MEITPKFMKMYKNGLFRFVHSGIKKMERNKSLLNIPCENQIKLNKVLILSKMTRFEYERLKFKNLNDEQFEKLLKDRGTNFDKLLYHNNLQKKNVKKIYKILKDIGSEVRIVNRYSYNKEAIKWADCVVPSGGDGTFLLAASLIKNDEIPVIGINSDPNRSEGYLCLPKKYSDEPKDAFEKLKSGYFQWMFRNRIRTTVIGATRMEPKLLHEIPLNGVDEICNNDWEVLNNNGGKILPVLALNEAFIGETLSAKVSHLELNFDNADHFTNTKCSGVCICTGTGSTSWHYSINRISVQTVADLLRLMDIDPSEDNLGRVYADIYNQNLKFSPGDLKMGYSIRDLISAGVWPDPKGIKSRGFAKKIVVKSNCDNAYIVIDGGLSFSFNDGTLAVFEMYPEDGLKTVMLD